MNLALYAGNSAIRVRHAVSRFAGHTRPLARLRAVVAVTLVCSATNSFGVLLSLKTVPVPQALDLGNYIQDQFAAIRLGKALFWDMQLGSDGIQACGTCHFHAGADRRSTNQINPGTNGGDSQAGNNNLGLPQLSPGALNLNQAVTATHFPFHRLQDPDAQGEPLNNPGNVISDINDVMSSQGVTLMDFVDIDPGNPVDLGTPVPDPVFQVDGINIRRVEPRNTPSVINAVFNFTNFWDGRANNIFNGNNPFGPADPRLHLITNASGNLQASELRLRQSSLASQAAGPPLSDFEMSWRGRTWPKIGKKMLSLTPLAQQQVSASDSVLGFLADTTSGSGLTTGYAAMIQAAFWPELWNNTIEKVLFDVDGNASIQAGSPVGTDEYTQMEANFGVFFSLAVQAYEATLLADDSRFDRFLEGNGALTTIEQQGLAIFNGAGGCLACHDGGETHDHGVLLIQGRDPITDVPTPLNENPIAANELMQISTGIALYDAGFHNSAVRPGGNSDASAPDFLLTSEDIGRGGLSGLGGSLEDISLSFGTLGLQNMGFLTPALPAFVAPWVPPLPVGFAPTDTTPFPNRVSNFGAVKTPPLRNVTLTGPYMHNGGMSTLRQVVDFYVRGGDFSTTNAMNFDTAILPIGLLRDRDDLKDALVQFLMTLTDQRVTNESAPFDHPEIFVPIHGDAPVSPGNRTDLLAMSSDFEQIPAVGAGGRSAQGLPPLGTFLGLNPRSVATNPDGDLDGIADSSDNCPLAANPGQEDGDGDGVGDACDICPVDPDNDSDADGVCGDIDNCPLSANADQADDDSDLVGNACDNCTLVANANQRDTDADGYGNACDADLTNADGLNTVNLSDYSLFRSVFGNTAPGTEPFTLSDHADMNDDGLVNLSDYSLFRASFGKAPGPSCCTGP